MKQHALTAASILLTLIEYLLYAFMLLAGIFCLFLGFYKLYDSYMVYNSTIDRNLRHIKANYGTNEDTGELLDSNIAWLTLEDTTIDYPVMQGEDNAEFLNKDPYGKYKLSGSIFLDYRNNKDLSDTYNIIYGHHMSGGFMFGALDKYHDEGYLEEHAEGTVKRKDGKAFALHLFAVLDTDASNRALFNMDYGSRDELMDYLHQTSEYYLERKETASGNIFALSTCRYPDTTDRTVVIGVLAEQP